MKLVRNRPDAREVFVESMVDTAAAWRLKAGRLHEGTGEAALRGAMLGARKGGVIRVAPYDPGVDGVPDSIDIATTSAENRLNVRRQDPHSSPDGLTLLLDDFLYVDAALGFNPQIQMLGHALARAAGINVAIKGLPVNLRTTTGFNLDVEPRNVRRMLDRWVDHLGARDRLGLDLAQSALKSTLTRADKEFETEDPVIAVISTFQQGYDTGTSRFDWASSLQQLSEKHASRVVPIRVDTWKVAEEVIEHGPLPALESKNMHLRRINDKLLKEAAVRL